MPEQRWLIEVEVDERGGVATTLYSHTDRVLFGCPIGGHDDGTGTVPVADLIRPLAERAAARAEEARSGTE